MAADSPRKSVAQPDWPSTHPNDRIVFLLDSSSRLERRLMDRWIATHRPKSTSDLDSSDDALNTKKGKSATSHSEFKSARDSHPHATIETIQLPSSRRGRHRRRSKLDPRLEEALATQGDPLMAPLRVIWRGPLRNGERTVSLLGLLTAGDPRDPNWLRQTWVLRSDPDRCVIVAGEPARASNLRERWIAACGPNSAETVGFAEFVSQKATLALERAERHVRGARYKVPRIVREEILGRPSFRGGLAQIVDKLRDEGRSGVSITRLASEAAGYLKEIAATHSPLIIDLVIQLIRWMYTRGYDEKLIYDETALKSIAELEERHPVVFLPTHKSNLDHLVLQYALHAHGLPPNHTAGGINMNFFPLGPLVRRSGVFFIRRTFRDNRVYKHVLAHYIDYLIEKRFPLEWYIEGGRSRSGKLLPPRFGLLANVVDSYRRGKSDDVYLVPVSIAYDQIQDLGSYVAEQRGGVKQKEGLSWLVGFIRGLKRRYGQIHIAFGEPLSLRQQLGDPSQSDHTNSSTKFDLEKVAFEVSVRINRVTPITSTSLVTLALLGTSGQALTVGETRRSLANLLEIVRLRGLPTTVDFNHLESDEGIEFTLNALVENDVLTRFDEGLETVYGIGDGQQFAAAYYRNTIVHFFVGSALIELATLHAIDGPRDQFLPRFWDEIMNLRDILKFEFFFPEKEIFRNEIRSEIELVSRNWEKRVEAYELDPEEMIRRTKPYFSHRILRPFLESYRVAGDQLTTIDAAATFDEKRFLSDCLGLGRQYELQKRIHGADSISKILFQSALKLAANRGLLESGGAEIANARQAFAEELRDAVRRVDIIVALAAGRRAGFKS
jgi:glycerol-3-phosphate O-acyltransferase